MKKLFLAAAIIFTPIFASADFSDTPGTVASEAVKYLEENKIVEGFSDGSFRPQNPITRAEFLKIALLASGKSADKCTPTKNFPDVREGEWYSNIVCVAVNDGIISGYGDGFMRPNDSISFAEAAKIVVNVNKIIPSESSAEWFQKYVDAVNRDRLFPGSVTDIHKKLTRGEMAQMAWGAATGNEVENLSRGDLLQIASCDELSAQLQKAQKRQSSSPFMGEPGMPEVANREADFSAPAMEKITEGSAADDFSTTNVQEFGVDEADIVKNDGSHIFLIKDNAIRIVQAFPADKLTEDAKFIIDKHFSPREMFLDGDTLTVIGGSFAEAASPPYHILEGDGEVVQEKIAADTAMMWYPQSQTTKVISLDVSDRKNPKKIREVSFEGDYLSSRKIDDTVFVALNRWNQYQYWSVPMLREDSGVIPLFSDSANTSESFVSGCAGIRYVPNFSHNNFLILAAIDTKNAAQKVDREVVLGGGENVYASSENLFVTHTKWGETYFDDRQNSGWENAEKTEIFKFALGKNSIDFMKKGEVSGHPLNQFSMSEFGKNFRIATQIGEAWNSAQKSSTALFVLDENLEKLGEVRDIAPGENMKSARFVGNKAYLVTFKTVDPLFVLDLSDPKNPKILGKLKIPGWSDYLHPWGENYLLGFGREVDESIDADKVHSDNAIYYTAVLGMKVALFDVSDLEHPKEVQKLVIGDRGTTSALLENHKALLADMEKGMVGFPITITKNMNGKTGENADIQTVFSGAIVLDIDVEKGITERGRATNYKNDEFFKKSGEWFYGDPDRNIDRIISIGDSLYTVARNYIEALSQEDLSVKKTLQLDEKTCEQIYLERECLDNSSCKATYYNSNYCSKVSGEDIVCTEDPQFSLCETINKSQ